MTKRTTIALSGSAGALLCAVLLLGGPAEAGKTVRYGMALLGLLDEGTSLGSAAELDCSGAGLACTVTGARATITVAAAGGLIAGNALVLTGSTLDVVGSGADDGLVILADSIAVDWEATAVDLSTINAGDAAAVGTQGQAARSDHQHPVATGAAGTSGLANTEGTATTLARSDHTHDQSADSIGSAEIVDLAIVNADVNAAAAISVSKTALTAGAGLLLTTDTLATASTEVAFLADGGITDLTCGAGQGGKLQVLDNGLLQWCDGAATSVLRRSAFGDVNGDAAGIVDLTIVNADVAAAAAIALSKLASGTDAQIIVASGTGVPTYAAMSGDLAITNTGATTIQANAVSLLTDTTGDHVATITAGAGLASTGAATGEGVAHTLRVASDETDFLTRSALTCGAGTGGRATISANLVLVCDDSIPPTLRTMVDTDSTQTLTGKTLTAAANAIEADTGDSATAFFTVGTLEDARLSANVSLLGQTISSAEILDAEIVNADLAGGSYTGITTVGTLTAITVTGVATLNGGVELGDTAADLISLNGVVDTNVTFSQGSTIRPIAAAADIAGNTMEINSGIGGVAVATAGGAGGSAIYRAGAGGNGVAALNPGNGGEVLIGAGAGGTLGSGNSTGGNVALRAGAGQGTGLAGIIQVGDTTTRQIQLGNATNNTTITQVGAGAVTLVGAVSANGAVTLGDAAGDAIASTGDFTFSNMMRSPIVSATVPAEPFACGATRTGAIVWVDDTDDAARARLCLCTTLDNIPTYDWVLVDDNALACPFF